MGQVVISDEAHRQLRLVAADEGSQISDLADKAVKDWLARRKTRRKKGKA